MARKIVSQQQHEQPIKFKEVASPATPEAGYAVIYVKTDGKPYIKDDAGTETDLTGSSGSGITQEMAIAFAVAL